LSNRFFTPAVSSRPFHIAARHAQQAVRRHVVLILRVHVVLVGVAGLERLRHGGAPVAHAPVQRRRMFPAEDGIVVRIAATLEMNSPPRSFW
jgi:hypothetical protein